MITGKFFQRPQIALALRARANCLALKKITCALENHAIAYTKKRGTQCVPGRIFNTCILSHELKWELCHLI